MMIINASFTKKVTRNGRSTYMHKNVCGIKVAGVWDDPRDPRHMALQAVLCGYRPSPKWVLDGYALVKEVPCGDQGV